jgi:hypothetical protein
LFSVLAATHKDRLRIDADVEKVQMRLRKEAGPFFRNIVMFSSVKANQSRDETAAVVDMDAWRASGVDFLQSGLADALAALSAEREQSAARAAQRIAAHILKKLQDSPQGGSDAGSLLALWSRQAEAMAARVTPENVRDFALLQEVALVIQGFGSGVLEPWLRQRVWTEASARLVGLFRCDPTMIASAIEGAPPQAAVRRVHGALRQLHGELSDALASPGSPLNAPQAYVGEARKALAPLIEAGRLG